MPGLADSAARGEKRLFRRLDKLNTGQKTWFIASPITAIIPPQGLGEFRYIHAPILFRKSQC